MSDERLVTDERAGEIVQPRNEWVSVFVLHTVRDLLYTRQKLIEALEHIGTTLKSGSCLEAACRDCEDAYDEARDTARTLLTQLHGSRDE